MVSDERQLKAALSDAGAGDVIVLDSRTFEGRFLATAHGSADAPIWLCGLSDARLDAGPVDTGYGLHFDGARHWRVVGVTISGGLKSLMLDDAHHNQFTDTHVVGAGHEAVHLRSGSTDNEFTRLSVDGAGLHEPQFGEGVYVGSASSNWCDVTACEPDSSDNNRFIELSVRATKAEPVDIKEGTAGGQITGARLDVSAMTEGDSYIDLKGAQWTVSGVRGTGKAQYGVALYAIEKPWGRDNRVIDNRFGVARTGSAVFVAESARDLGNVLCANRAQLPDGRVSTAEQPQPCDDETAARRP